MDALTVEGGSCLDIKHNSQRSHDSGAYVDDCPNRDNEGFVTVVTVCPNISDNNINNCETAMTANENDFVTVLSVGNSEDAILTLPAEPEDVLVYRLPGEKLGFGLKFEGGLNAAEKISKLLIQCCAADSPASRTVVSWGYLSPGDEIREIDGVPVSHMTRVECVRRLKESNVVLKLKVCKGVPKSVTEPGKPSLDRSLSLPPPVPPRKYPRRISAPKTRPCTVPIIYPPNVRNDRCFDMDYCAEELKHRRSSDVPSAEVYTNLIGQEYVVGPESESDDTGSSMSTVVDKFPSTSNSSFSDAKSVTSLDISTTPSSPGMTNKQLDLHKVLEPFLELEREFSSSAIENQHLFKELVAATVLKTESECEESSNQGSSTYIISETSEQQLSILLARKSSLETPGGKYKKRPPPPPPPHPEPRRRKSLENPDLTAENIDEINNSSAEDGEHHLPRLIDFVPKDRTDVVVPNAVHPLEHHCVTILDSNTECDVKCDNEAAKPEQINIIQAGSKIVTAEIFIAQNQEFAEVPAEENRENTATENVITESVNKNEYYDSVDSPCCDLMDSFDHVSDSSPEILEDNSQQQQCLVPSTPEFNTRFADKNNDNVFENVQDVDRDALKASDTENEMESMTTVASSPANLKSSPPPSFSRLPPDGHEFPSDYQEVSLDTGNRNEVLKGSPNGASLKKRSSHADVVNEAKILEVCRKYSCPTTMEDSSQACYRSQLWRNDEKSERSVKDKIAMFSGGVMGSSPPLAQNPRFRNVDDSSITTTKSVGYSKPYSKSVLSVNHIGTPNNTKNEEESLEKNIRPYSSSSMDLTFSSSSSAYSSCSPESSLSPMSSPTYVTGSSSTLPRKHKVQSSTTEFNATSCSNSSSSSEKKHSTLTRATSFAGSTNLHSRSQSFDVLLSSPYARTEDKDTTRTGKDSLATLIEQRRRTMSKLRGLVIPEKVSEIDQQPITDLPEIKTKENYPVLNKIMMTSTPDKADAINNGMDVSRKMSCDLSWKFVPQPFSDVSKYSPAFKRKSLAVYGSSSASSLSSSLSSSREELRSEQIPLTKSAKPVPPLKPPRNSLSSNVSQTGKIKETNASCQKSVVDTNKSDTSKITDDSDNDSAVSSSRSSLCHDLSPPISPVPQQQQSYLENMIHNSSESCSPSSSNRTLRRTLSSDTASVTSTLSTLTSSSHVSTSSGESFDDTKCKRILKAQSVEAIHRKSVLSCAKYSSGQDFKISSPLIQKVIGNELKNSLEGISKIEKPAENEAWSTTYLEQKKQETNVKIAYLEVQDLEEENIVKRVTQTQLCEETSSSNCESDKDSISDTLEAKDHTYSRTQTWDTVDSRKSTDEDVDKVEKTVPKMSALSSSKIRDFGATKIQDVRKNIYGRQCSVPESRYSYSRGAPNKPVSVNDLRRAFEKGTVENGTLQQVRREPLNLKQSQLRRDNYHARMSSLDSTTSEESFLPRSPSQYGSTSNLLKDQQFGSITSLASSTSLISQQELQQLIDDANHTLEETTGSGSGHDVMVIILHRDTATSSVGITLAGGADYECKEITVHKVLVGSPADRDGRIQKGDRILSINGRSMKDVTHREALSILKAPRSEVVLVVSRWKSDSSVATTTSVDMLGNLKNLSRPSRVPEIAQPSVVNSDVAGKVANSKGPVITVTLKKDGAGLGFSLEGGKDSPLGDLPLTIKKIFTGGCAEKSGLLQAGDELLSLNRTDVTSMSRTEAWNLMKRLPDGEVVLTIRR